MGLNSRKYKFSVKAAHEDIVTIAEGERHSDERQKQHGGTLEDSGQNLP